MKRLESKDLNYDKSRLWTASKQSLRAGPFLSSPPTNPHAALHRARPVRKPTRSCGNNAAIATIGRRPRPSHQAERALAQRSAELRLADERRGRAGPGRVAQLKREGDVEGEANRGPEPQGEQHGPRPSPKGDRPRTRPRQSPSLARRLAHRRLDRWGGPLCALPASMVSSRRPAVNARRHRLGEGR